MTSNSENIQHLVNRFDRLVSDMERLKSIINEQNARLSLLERANEPNPLLPQLQDIQTYQPVPQMQGTQSYQPTHPKQPFHRFYKVMDVQDVMRVTI